VADESTVVASLSTPSPVGAALAGLAIKPAKLNAATIVRALQQDIRTVSFGFLIE
jgi:hypothetical protein